MSDKAKKKIGVFIGRFQPFHIGHLYVIRFALRFVDCLVIMIGSANRSRSPSNPFTYEERMDFIRREFRKEIEEKRIIIAPLDDTGQDSSWQENVKKKTENEVARSGIPLENADFNLVGYAKDGSSYYLKMFPEWGEIAVDGQFGTFSATDIRGDFLRRAPIIPHDNCPASVVEFLKVFRLGEEFKWLLAELEAENAYKAPYAGLPYPPKFITTDSVVTQNGLVLMIRRGKRPGKGLLAIPGGHLENDLTLWQNALKELEEETGIPREFAQRHAKGAGIAVDDPTRSSRGRTVTHVFRFELPSGPQIEVVAGDDANEAFWIDPKDIDPRECFEDHYLILQSLGLTD